MDDGIEIKLYAETLADLKIIKYNVLNDMLDKCEIDYINNEEAHILRRFCINILIKKVNIDYGPRFTTDSHLPLDLRSNALKCNINEENND